MSIEQPCGHAPAQQPQKAKDGKNGPCTKEERSTPSAKGSTYIISGDLTTSAPTAAAGAIIGDAMGGPPGAVIGGYLGTLFGVGGTVSYVPSTNSLYAGPTVVFAPAVGGGSGFSVNVVSVPAGQDPNSIASGWSFSQTLQPSPLLGSTVVKSPGSGPAVVGGSVGTRVPTSASINYGFTVLKGGC